MTPGVDLHSDLLLDVLARGLAGRPAAFRERHLEPLRRAGVRVQVLAVWVDPYAPPEGALRETMRAIAAAHRVAEESDGALRLVTTAAELDAALAEGAVAGMLALEGVDGLGRDPELVDLLVRLGVRMVGLTWNAANAFADGAGEGRDGGLTTAGRALVTRLGELGVSLDLSHLSRRGCAEALEVATGPVLASHCLTDAVHASSRNLRDDVIAEVARRDGVVGLNFLPVFAGPGETMERVADHHEHLVAIGGAGLPACGADFVGYLPREPEEDLAAWLPPDADVALGALPEPPREQAYATLAAALRARGHDDAHVDGVLGGNALRFLRRTLG